MRFLSVFAAGFAAFTGLAGLGGGAAQAATVNVACDFAAIQAAANAATAGDTIHIAAGTCNGS